LAKERKKTPVTPSQLPIGVTTRPLPRWLEKVTLDQEGRIRRGKFPLRDVLADSLYYPASGFDRTPVHALGGFVHSFVYVDYGITELDLLLLVRDTAKSFRGYRLFGSRPVTADEIGLTRNPLPTMDHPPRASDRVKPYFALWMVFERLAQVPSDDPRRLSVLFVCADGVSMYDTLYGRNETAPLVLAVIRSGAGAGGNWTDFTDPRASFANLVLRRNGERLPGHVLCDGPQAIWAERYPELLGRLADDREVGLWRRPVSS
jgi:hypothetical protein